LNAILKLHHLDCIENLSKKNNDIDTMQEVFTMQETLMALKLSNDADAIKQLYDKLKERLVAIEVAFMLAHKNNNIDELQKQAIRFSYFSKFQKNML